MRVGTHAHSRRARDSARLRAGICQTYDFIVQERLRAGHLVEALPLRGPTRPFSVVYAPHRRLSAASRTLIDMRVTSAARACTDSNTGGP